MSEKQDSKQESPQTQDPPPASPQPAAFFNGTPDATVAKAIATMQSGAQEKK